MSNFLRFGPHLLINRSEILSITLESESRGYKPYIIIKYIQRSKSYIDDVIFDFDSYNAAQIFMDDICRQLYTGDVSPVVQNEKR